MVGRRPGKVDVAKGDREVDPDKISSPTLIFGLLTLWERSRKRIF
jgi:hypothetical protein